jgi:tRNA-specific 2-thiouridylase
VPASPFRATVRIRHRARLIPATARSLGEKRWAIATDAPVWAAAPGQAAVLYHGDEVLGGGRIEAPERVAPSQATEADAATRDRAGLLTPA